jgi:2-C-methyl-D-erythritol 4-phosphate cytidylyltransferase
MGKLGVVIVAAGKGSRMRTTESKQYLLLSGKPILVHTLELFERIADVSSIVLVVGATDLERCRKYAREYKLGKIVDVIPGGAERQHSVMEGLQALPSDTEWVLVHDGVRPFVTEEQVLACWHQAMRTEAAVLAVPVKDTIKIVNASGQIQSTPERRSLWSIQTPQAFRLSLLLEAHRRAAEDGFLGTDDSILVERLGVAVQVVEGDYYNIKITTPEDLHWAEWIVKHIRGERNR